MTSYLQLRDPSIFPSPDTFNPSRWLDSPKAPSGRPLSKYLVVFGRGPRMCLGMNFAMTEIFLAIAGVFRRVGDDLVLWEMERDSVDMASGYFVPMPKEGTKGVRVIVK
jgi:cytochrome P450